MNIFNMAYFDPVRLRQGALSVWRSLRRGGVWIVGRSMEQSPMLHHASILVRTAQGFVLMERYIDKSEMEDMALALQPDVDDGNDGV
jgi:hypothetical protein